MRKMILDNKLMRQDYDIVGRIHILSIQRIKHQILLHFKCFNIIHTCLHIEHKMQVDGVQIMQSINQTRLCINVQDFVLWCSFVRKCRCFNLLFSPLKFTTGYYAAVFLLLKYVIVIYLYFLLPSNNNLFSLHIIYIPLW